MAAGTTPRSPLDGLLFCGHCGAEMRLVSPAEGNEVQYTCNRVSDNHKDPHPTLHLPARIADHLIIGNVLYAVLTDKAISIVESAIVQSNDGENTNRTLCNEDIRLLRDDPQYFLKAVKTPEKAKNFLAMFVTRIMLFPHRAVVHYAMPLPSDSHLSGAIEQEVLLSANLAS